MSLNGALDRVGWAALSGRSRFRALGLVAGLVAGLGLTPGFAAAGDALQVMSGAQIKRVPVVNSNNEIVGIVSMGDIATESNETGKVGKTVEDISKASPNN